MSDLAYKTQIFHSIQKMAFSENEKPKEFNSLYHQLYILLEQRKEIAKEYLKNSTTDEYQNELYKLLLHYNDQIKLLLYITID